MALVTVEVADLAAASGEMARSVADPLSRAVGDAVADVLSGGGMAGDDPAATQWSSAYDRIAPTAIQAAEDVINSCYRVSAMLAATARNYAAAEAASTVRGHHVDPHITRAITRLPDDTRIGLPSAVPSAAGGGSGGPPGWHFVAHHLGGYVWPNGHQDRLRAAAAAWHASAAALENHSTPAAFVDLRPLVDRLREGPDIATVCNALSEHLDDVARVHRGLARACSDLAHHIDQAHSLIEHELGELLAWTAGIQAVGTVAAIFSFGAAEAPTQAEQAARIAATVAKIVGILRDFVLAVRTVLAGITPLAGAIADVRAAVAWLKDLRIVQVEVAAVPGLRVYQIARVERAGNEAAATTKVATQEQAGLERLASETYASGTPNSWANEGTLTDHYARHGADFGSQSMEDYAAKARDFFRDHGEGTIEVKIDKTDGTIRVYDKASNTLGVYTPDGLTRTFFKPKAGLAYWLRQPGDLK